MIIQFISILAAAVLFTGGSTSAGSEAAPNAATVINSISMQPGKAAVIPAGRYVGTIPCADCGGIQMELTLKEPQGNKGRTFILKQTYLGKTTSSNKTVEIDGKWFAASGNKQNPKAVVLQLIPSSEKYDPSYFLQINKSQLKMLDRQQNEIKSKQNYTLKKQ